MPSQGPGRVTRTVHTNSNILQLPMLCRHTVHYPFHLGEKQVKAKERVDIIEWMKQYRTEYT